MTIAVPGLPYAQVLNGLVHWKFSAAQLPEWNENQFVAVDISDVSPIPEVGWSAASGKSGWRFAAPPAPPAPSIAQQAAAALDAGISVQSSSVSGLNAVYPCDSTAWNKITATAQGIAVRGKFAAGLKSLPWADINGTVHTFPSTGLFIEFAGAVADYVTALEMCVIGASGSLPASGVVIS